MPAILLWFLGPIGRYVGIALIVVATVGGFGAREYYKGWKNEHDKWIAAEKAALERGSKARDDAASSVDNGSVRDSRDTDQ